MGSGPGVVDSVKKWTGELWTEVKARRAGRKRVDNSIGRAARDVTGPTGWVWSNAWQQLDDHGDAYIKSFDQRLPPSTFVSERDRVRHNHAMPVAERCIEDYRPSRSADSPRQEPGRRV